MNRVILVIAAIILATSLTAETAPRMSNDLTVTMTPQRYRICNDRPARPVWMDEIHPREAYKALTLMRLYELRSWEAIRVSGDCGCDVRFPPWDIASAEYEEWLVTNSQAEHTQIQLALREQQALIAREVQDICETQGNW